MKKFLVAILAFASLFALVSCSDAVAIPKQSHISIKAFVGDSTGDCKIEFPVDSNGILQINYHEFDTYDELMKNSPTPKDPCLIFVPEFDEDILGERDADEVDFQYEICLDVNGIPQLVSNNADSCGYEYTSGIKGIYIPAENVLPEGPFTGIPYGSKGYIRVYAKDEDDELLYVGTQFFEVAEALSFNGVKFATGKELSEVDPSSSYQYDITPSDISLRTEIDPSTKYYSYLEEVELLHSFGAYDSEYYYDGEVPLKDMLIMLGAVSSVEEIEDSKSFIEDIVDGFKESLASEYGGSMYPEQTKKFVDDSVSVFYVNKNNLEAFDAGEIYPLDTTKYTMAGKGFSLDVSINENNAYSKHFENGLNYEAFGLMVQNAFLENNNLLQMVIPNFEEVLLPNETAFSDKQQLGYIYEYDDLSQKIFDSSIIPNELNSYEQIEQMLKIEDSDYLSMLLETLETAGMLKAYGYIQGEYYSNDLVLPGGEVPEPRYLALSRFVNIPVLVLEVDGSNYQNGFMHYVIVVFDGPDVAIPRIL